MTRLSKYEKETILLTSEGDDTWDIYTFNPSLKRRMAAFAEKYPQCCRLKAITKEGSVTYQPEKSRVSIHLNAPVSEERKNALRSSMKSRGLLKLQESSPSEKEDSKTSVITGNLEHKGDAVNRVTLI